MLWSRCHYQCTMRAMSQTSRSSSCCAVSGWTGCTGQWPTTWQWQWARRKWLCSLRSQPHHSHRAGAVSNCVDGSVICLKSRAGVVSEWFPCAACGELCPSCTGLCSHVAAALCKSAKLLGFSLCQVCAAPRDQLWWHPAAEHPFLTCGFYPKSWLWSCQWPHETGWENRV